MGKPYKKEFAGVFLLMILVAVTTLLNPEIQKHLINDVLREGGRLRDALVFLGIMFMLSVSIVIINIMKSMVILVPVREIDRFLYLSFHCIVYPGSGNHDRL